MSSQASAKGQYLRDAITKIVTQSYHGWFPAVYEILEENQIADREQFYAHAQAVEDRLITTSAGRRVGSFGQFLEDCYEACGERSTRVLDLANQEWTTGKRNVSRVKARKDKA